VNINGKARHLREIGSRQVQLLNFSSDLQCCGLLSAAVESEKDEAKRD
jgi:hypothetical protein